MAQPGITTQLTITEAIAELKTISAKINKKREFIGGSLARQEAFRDPHEKEGGSRIVIDRELQAINDLEERSLKIRNAIQEANRTNDIVVSGRSRSINDWLCWRREVAPGRKDHLRKMQQTITGLRGEAQKKGWQIASESKEGMKGTDLIVHVSEVDLAKQIEEMEEVLGTLDGQLSLKNATILVNI